MIMYWNTVGLSNSKECFDNNKIYHEVCCSHTVYGLTVVLTTLYHVFLIIFREQKVGSGAHTCTSLTYTSCVDVRHGEWS